jgi:hypothetical protein
MVTGDFNGDGKLDLAVESSGGSLIAVLLGNGDGSFQTLKFYAVGTSSGYGAESNLVAGDFNGDGHLDLAVANSGSNDVSILLGNGDGTFQPAVEYAVGQQPMSIVAGDFNGDGRLDLATANASSNDISVLLGNGDGTFQPAKEYAAGNRPFALVAGDFNGDGKLDLAVTGSSLSVLLGNGDGTFQAPKTFAGGALVAGDFNGDGRIDLATLGRASIYVLLGNGDGTFQAPKEYASGLLASTLVAGDFTGDGRLDLATGGVRLNGISVLLNNGDGTFAEKQQAEFGPSFRSQPRSLVAADFNGDGRLDLATANTGSNDISVLLGNGDGTFQPQQLYAAGNGPVALVAGDFNGDGRLDLAVAHFLDNMVSVLLGNGDGTFQPAVEYAAGNEPFALVAGDFNGDGKLDLAVLDGGDANGNGTGVSMLLGNGDGTFRPAKLYAAGNGPDSLVAGDFNGDGNLDLAVVDSGDANGNGTGVSMLLGNGDGTFQAPKFFAAPGVGYAGPASLVAGDFNGDGRLDLATLNGFNDISVLLGNGDGTFRAQETIATGSFPIPLVAGDFNGDGRLDLATGNYGDVGDPIRRRSISVWLGNGDGTFQPAQKYPLGQGGYAPSPVALVVGDFNGDGRLDLAVVDRGALAYGYGTGVGVLLGNGGGTFTDPGQLVTTPRATPLEADVNGDGTDDVLVVDGAGNILYRRGIPGQPGAFDPPITVNPGFPSRDIVWVPNTLEGPLLASVDAKDNAISSYAWRDGGFIRVGSLTTGRLPAQIVAADLSRDGWDDLVVRNAGDGTLSVFRNNGLGSFWTGFDQPFLPPVTIPVGIGVSDVAAVDFTGLRIPDLVVTNKLTGQVSILHNWGDGSFAAPVPYRAGTGLSAINLDGTPEATSLEATAGVAAGAFTTGGPTDLVTINPGSNTLDLLAGLGGDRFANPVTIDTPSPAQVVRMGDFTGNGIDDLAVLTATGLSIYLGNGKGGFLPPTTYAVPSEADGLTVTDLLGNGKLDLLVGDAYGDVLVLLGNGDGTFRPSREANQSIELAVADLTGNPGGGHAGRPQRRRHPRPDRGQQRQQQRADLPRAGEWPVRAGRQRREWLFRRHQPGGDHRGRPHRPDVAQWTIAAGPGGRRQGLQPGLDPAQSGELHLHPGSAAEFRRHGAGLDRGWPLHWRPLSRPPGHQQRIQRRQAIARQGSRVLQRHQPHDLHCG